MRSRPEVTVVIPTHNRQGSLRRVLAALGAQTLAPGRFDVIVVADACTDQTVPMCREMVTPYRLRVIALAQKEGPAGARNHAVEDASGEVIVFIDDDVVPDPDLLCEHLQVHSEDARAVGIGPLLPPEGFAMKPWIRWEAATLQEQYRDVVNGRWQPGPRLFFTGNASVRREHLMAAGGFDPNYRRAEDVELAFRLQQLGLRFRFRAEAQGWHFAQRSLRSWLDIPLAYGEADVKMSREGRRSILTDAAGEFHSRRRPLRSLARACVGRSVLLGPAVALSLVAAQLADWARLTRAADAAYSVIFNLRYWHSISSQVGRATFWKMVRAQS